MHLVHFGLLIYNSLPLLTPSGYLSTFFHVNLTPSEFRSCWFNEKFEEWECCTALWHTFFFPARAFMSQPATPEPVKVRSLNRSSQVNTSASWRDTGRIENAPLGRSSQDSRIWPKIKADRGVRLLGFNTKEQPTASAGATLCATRFNGKFQGLTIDTGPIGNFRTMPCTFETLSASIPPNTRTVHNPLQY